MDERLVLLGLRLVPGIGPQRLRTLLDHYGSAAEAWRCRHRWEDVPGIGPAIAAAARRLREEQVERHWARLEALGGRMVTWEDPEYPAGLQHIPVPPPILFVRGQLPADIDGCLAIVGTRRASSQGLRVARTLARDVAAVGMTVISGLARGIDGAAHQGALEGRGRTVAVLGCGLDIAYPPEHRELMEAIAAAGALVTEYPLGTPPAPGHFPTRNRIIAGLAQAVVLVEGSRRSGAMHTVTMAADFGREVMAVPGDVGRWGSEGPNQLLREGATLVRHGADVLESLGWTGSGLAQARVAGSPHAGPAAGQARGADPAARIVACLREGGALSVDELAAALEMPVDAVVGAVVGLELAGRVVRRAGGRFALPG
ncbi:MAG TPA: DNA-processing protein DprA [Limnochordales bacterium]|nr:DNA-processing protein DprA [Limnochordales bacterium]